MAVETNRRLAPSTFRLLVDHNVRVPMRDGVELVAEVFRPDTDARRR